MMIALALAFALSAPLQDSQAEPATPAIVTIDGDEHQRYILHAPEQSTKAPKDGWKVLVVMPGGSGSPDFAPFVGNIRRNALDDEWLLVQMIAPVWSERQAKENVWPTKLNPSPKMEFTCEELFDRVIAHVEETRELDPRYLLTLAWSSSGTLAYTLGLAEDSRVTGSFVAMSVYRPEWLPSHKHAKKRRFYLYHSPDDWIPLQHAERAQEALEKKKAEVELTTYAGGHGWHGDVFGDLRTGLAWLEKHAKKAKAPKRKRK